MDVGIAICISDGSWELATMRVERCDFLNPETFQNPSLGDIYDALEDRVLQLENAITFGIVWVEVNHETST